MQAWRIIAFAVALIVISLTKAPAQSGSGVDLALVLAVNASGSVDDNEYALQRDGIAGAISDPDVLAAIKSGRYRQIAVTLVEWGTPGAPAQVVRWHVIGGEERALDFAMDVRRADRELQSWNAIGDGIELGMTLIADCGCAPTRQVIDVSGDGPDHGGQVAASVARDQAIKAGITINALAILKDNRKGPNGRPWLVEDYEQEVIGGPGAFVTTAQTRADFDQALKRKLIQEIASR